MLSQNDKLQIKERGSRLETVQSQIENFKKGFPYLEVEEAATVGKGIIRLDESEVQSSGSFFDEKIASGIKPLKFVPASGAASRMFKVLFKVLENYGAADNPDGMVVKSPDARKFLANKEKFAFYNDLEEVIDKSKVQKNCKSWIDFLLNDKGLGYGTLPKGLIKFHKYPDGERTPFEEHLVEGAVFGKDNIRIQIVQIFNKSPMPPRTEKQAAIRFPEWFIL